MFNQETAPYFMTIKWDLANKGDTITLSNDQINNDTRNIKTIERMALNHGVYIETGYTQDGIIIIVQKTKQKSFKTEDCDSIFLFISDINENPTVTDICKNAGITGSRAQVGACLRHMVKAGILEEQKHQHDGGGRPTTKYKIIK